MGRSVMIIGLVMFGVFRFTGYFTEPRLSSAQIHRVEGEPRHVTGQPELRRPARVVTWNIERGVNFDKIAAALRSMDADVILLQEVDRFCRRSASRDVPRDLAAALGMNWTWGGEFQEIGEARDGVAATTGQAILSRYPIEDSAVIVFSAQARWKWRFNPAQPRFGARIVLRARTAGVLLYNVHLESGSRGDPLRELQVKDVLGDAAREPDGPAVIAGDFNNSAEARSSLLSTLTSRNFTDAVGGDHQTQIHHAQAIDWIFARGVLTTGGQVDRLKNVSDHYPVIATLSVQ